MAILRHMGSIAIGLLVTIIIGMVLVNSGITIPPGVWFIAGLLIAATMLLVGEYLIKTWSLTDRAASVARFTTGLIALIISLGTIFPFWNGTMPNISWIGSLYNFVTADWVQATQVLAALLIGGVVVYGAYREMKTSSGNIAIFFWRAAFTLIVVVAFLTWLIGPQLMQQVGTVVQTGARNQLSAWLNGQQINPNVDWGKAALGGLGLLFLAGLWKMQIIQKGAMVTGAIIWLPFIAWLAWGSLPAEYKQGVNNVVGTVTGAAEGVYESLPMLGEDHYVNLAADPDGKRVVSNIGPYDTVTVYIARGTCGVGWEATNAWQAEYGNADWYDPEGYYLTKVRGGNSVQRTYAFTESFKEGLKTAGAKLQLEIRQLPC